jgi:hypothetical protein
LFTGGKDTYDVAHRCRRPCFDAPSVLEEDPIAKPLLKIATLGLLATANLSGITGQPAKAQAPAASGTGGQNTAGAPQPNSSVPVPEWAKAASTVGIENTPERQKACGGAEAAETKRKQDEAKNEKMGWQKIKDNTHYTGWGQKKDPLVEGYKICVSNIPAQTTGRPPVPSQTPSTSATAPSGMLVPITPSHDGYIQSPRYVGQEEPKPRDPTQELDYKTGALVKADDWPLQHKGITDRMGKVYGIISVNGMNVKVVPDFSTQPVFVQRKDAKGNVSADQVYEYFKSFNADGRLMKKELEFKVDHNTNAVLWREAHSAKSK